MGRVPLVVADDPKVRHVRLNPLVLWTRLVLRLSPHVRLLRLVVDGNVPVEVAIEAFANARRRP